MNNQWMINKVKKKQNKTLYIHTVFIDIFRMQLSSTSTHKSRK